MGFSELKQNQFEYFLFIRGNGDPGSVVLVDDHARREYSVFGFNIVSIPGTNDCRFVIVDTEEKKSLVIDGRGRIIPDEGRSVAETVALVTFSGRVSLCFFEDDGVKSVTIRKSVGESSESVELIPGEVYRREFLDGQDG